MREVHTYCDICGREMGKNLRPSNSFIDGDSCIECDNIINEAIRIVKESTIEILRRSANAAKRNSDAD